MSVEKKEEWVMSKIRKFIERHFVEILCILALLAGLWVSYSIEDQIQ